MRPWEKFQYSLEENMQKQMVLGVALFLLILSHSVLTFSNEIEKIGDLYRDVTALNLLTGDLPFIQNVGQFDEKVMASVNTISGTAHVTKKGEIFYSHISEVNSLSVFREFLISADINKFEYRDQFKPAVNIFQNNNGLTLAGVVPAWHSLWFENIYDGIDLYLNATSNNIEKIFLIKPGADPSNIKIGVDGTDNIFINDLGQLEICNKRNKLVFTAPVAYQEINGCRKYIDVNYLLEYNKYGFELGAYNHSLPLIIDPLIASSYLGGSGTEGGDEFWWVNAETAPDGSIYFAGMINYSEGNFEYLTGWINSIK